MGRNKTAQLECQSCSKLKAESNSNFYIHSHPLFKKSGFLPICKECIKKFLSYTNQSNFLDRFKLVLALLNRPFLPEVLEMCDGDWGDYLRQTGSLRQHKSLTFANSDFQIDKITSIPLTDEPIEYGDDELYELVKYWGKGYENTEYEYLEEEKLKLMASFECPDYGMEMIMRDICFINLNIEKIRQEQKANGSKEISNLIKTRSELMNDAKMKPIQATGSDANDQLSFGVLVKKWENEKPVPKGIDDEMKRYIDTFMVGHLAKMEGLNNELTERYDAALQEYTIDFDEVRRNDSYEDD